MVSLAYPIDKLDWAFFSVVILSHHWWAGRGGEPPTRGAGLPSLSLTNNVARVTKVVPDR